jgi:predicted neuraminidase
MNRKIIAAMITIVSISLPLLVEAAQAHAGLLRSEFIYETAPFPSCHASTIVEPKGGGLVAAWFGGTHEKHPDVGIWVSRLVEGKWTVPVEVANGLQSDGTRHPCWNSVLFQPRDGALMLFYKVGPDPRSWWGMLRTSEDGGQTWSDARRLPEGILGPIKNKPVQLGNGDILCPSSSELPGTNQAWRVHFERTSDLGLSWAKVSPAPKTGGQQLNAIQPSILIHSPQRLQAIGRTRNERVFETWSDDGGRTWTPLTLTALPNPNSGTDAVTLRDGRHLIVYNHTSKGRSPLNVAVSRDGKAWQAALVLESDSGEYSYPAIIQTKDGLVHITYTWKRQRVRHVVIDPARLSPRDMVNGNWPK